MSAGAILMRDAGRDAGSLRFPQTWAVVLYELKKAVAGRRWVAPSVLATAPLLLLAARVFLPGPGSENAEVLETVFARLFEAYMLRLGIFFACVAVFVQLFRRDVQERTLHGYLLVPVGRHRILLGKYVAGLIHVVFFFVPATAASYVLLFLPGGTAMLGGHFLGGGGLWRLAAYIALVCLATAGYGAVFIAVGTLARNPVVPVLLVLLFESVDAYLPAPLQSVSIVHSLTALSPGSESGLAWTGVAGGCLLTLASLFLAARATKRAEVSYGTD